MIMIDCSSLGGNDIWFLLVADAQWKRIAPLLPTDGRGKQRVDDRWVLSGIVHALRCGGRWSDCTDVYGPKKTLYNRFVRWSERGIWDCIFSVLVGAEDAPVSRSTSVRAEEKGTLAHGIGRTKGGRNTKLLAVCDAKGRPRPSPDTAERSRLQGRATLHRSHAASRELVANKGYDNHSLRDWLDERGTKAVNSAPQEPQNPVRIRQDHLQAAKRHRAHVLAA